MGIETAALLATGAGAAGGTAATAAGVGALGAAGAGAAGAAGAGLAGAGAAGATAAASGAGVVAGSLEAANLVGAIGGDALGAFISANQGFGTMTAAESIAGMGAALESSPYVQALQQGMEAADQQPEQPEQPVKQSTAPAAYEQRGPNQNPSLTQQSSLMQQNNSTSSSSLDALGFADGGIVPSLQSLFSDNIFARTSQRREQEAGLAPQSTPSNITINVGGQGQGQAGNQQQQQPGNVPRSTAETPSVSDFANSVLQLIRSGAGYQDGGTVRTGSSDVRAGGEIRGPQSKSGRDNQIIKVAGGEGILPVDVMDVPGVADLVQSLISTFHKPVK